MRNLLDWIRWRAAEDDQVASETCVSCRGSIPGGTSEELFFSGGVFLPGAGWFCGTQCESAYRLRFRVQPGATPPGGTSIVQAPSTGVAPTEKSSRPRSYGSALNALGQTLFDSLG